MWLYILTVIFSVVLVINILPLNVLTRNGFGHDKIDLTRGYLFEYGKTLVNKSAILDDVDS